MVKVLTVQSEITAFMSVLFNMQSLNILEFDRFLSLDGAQAQDIRQQVAVFITIKLITYFEYWFYEVTEGAK